MELGNRADYRDCTLTAAEAGREASAVDRRAPAELAREVLGVDAPWKTG
ncbi:hypothetical protein AB5J72_43925 [Streptomyces sp. CG1]